MQGIHFLAFFIKEKLVNIYRTEKRKGECKVNKGILDDVNKLMTLTEEDLTDVLLDKKYNKALLRELVRRSLRVANDYKNALEYEKNEREETEEILKLYEHKNAE